jgi:hypothetical protein
MISKQTKLKLENYIRKSKKINNEIWYHQTNQNASNSILKNGFRVFPGYGQARYTEGVYFLHHPDGGYGDVTLTATINGTFVDYSDDDFLFDWVDFKNSVEWDNYSDLTKIVQQIHPECDGIVFQSILVVWYPNKVIKNVNVLKSTKGIFTESSKKLKSTLKSYIRRLVTEEIKGHKIHEVQSRYFISYYTRVGEHGEAGTYPDFKSAYRAAVAKSRNEDFMDGLDYLGVEGSGTNANQFAIIYINDFYLNNRLGSSDFDNKDAANKFRTVAKKVLATGRPVRSTYSN